MDLVMFPILYVVTYGTLFALLPLFFGQPIPRPTRSSVYSVVLLIIAIEVAFYLVDAFLLPPLSNRVLHMVGGGMLAYFLYYCVMNDLKISVPRVQFFMLGFMVVTTLGVANELLELVLHVTRLRVFPIIDIDTWLDLANNTSGAIVAGVPLTYIYQQKNVI